MSETTQKRRPFNEEVQAMATVFADDLLDTIPELQSVAIIPNYGELNNKFPPMFLGIRDELRGSVRPAELVNTGQQVVRSLGLIYNMATNMLREVDDYMAKQSQALAQLEAQKKEGTNGAPDSTDTGTSPATGSPDA